MKYEPFKNGGKGERDPNTGKFLPGHSGGPGRPKDSVSITGAIKRMLQEVPSGERETYLALIVERITESARAGDFKMIRQVWSYVDGLPKQTLEQPGVQMRPIPILSYLVDKKMKISRKTVKSRTCSHWRNVGKSTQN